MRNSEEPIRNRARFVPHLFCRCERQHPEQIAIYGFINGEKLRRAVLPSDFNDLTESQQQDAIRKAVAHKLALHSGTVPTLGKILGFTLVRSPDEAPRDALPQAEKPNGQETPP